METNSNVYAAPKSNFDSEPSAEYVIASKWRRFFTWVIDYVCYLSMAFVFGVMIYLVFGERGTKAMQSIPDLLLGVLLLTPYYLFFEGIWGRTPGKLLCGTRIIDENNRKPNFGTIFKRTLCRFIPFEPLSCLGETPWHDKISDTRVVLAKPT